MGGSSKKAEGGGLDYLYTPGVREALPCNKKFQVT